MTALKLPPPARLAVLFFMGSVLRTAQGITPEEYAAYCAIHPSSCRRCRKLCMYGGYTKFGRNFYSSGCGEYCDEREGTINAIDFHYKSFTTLGPEIGSLSNLAILDITSNSLTTLPDSFRSLKSLTALYAHILSHASCGQPYVFLFYLDT